MQPQARALVLDVAATRSRGQTWGYSLLSGTFKTVAYIVLLALNGCRPRFLKDRWQDRSR